MHYATPNMFVAFAAMLPLISQEWRHAREITEPELVDPDDIDSKGLCTDKLPTGYTSCAGRSGTSLTISEAAGCISGFRFS
mmetsp:Transcript_2844/g.8355  ORF Transcript_2844/g.8355 Transcript_2844/m.8355 type:complete len:81 (+) Transcript_2844:264-506(+)